MDPGAQKDDILSLTYHCEGPGAVSLFLLLSLMLLLSTTLINMKQQLCTNHPTSPKGHCPRMEPIQKQAGISRGHSYGDALQALRSICV